MMWFHVRQAYSENEWEYTCNNITNDTMQKLVGYSVDKVTTETVLK